MGQNKVNESFLKTTGYMVFKVLFYEFDKLRNLKEDKHLPSHLSLGKSCPSYIGRKDYVMLGHKDCGDKRSKRDL